MQKKVGTGRRGFSLRCELQLPFLLVRRVCFASAEGEGVHRCVSGLLAVVLQEPGTTVD